MDLSWTDYQGFPFTQYYILRDNNANNNWVKIDSVPFNLANQYTDFGGTHPVPTDSARYIIEAAPAQPCNATIKNPNAQATSVKASKSNTSDKTMVPVAVSENPSQNWIFVYPNPSNGMFTVSSRNELITNIILYNALGEIVYESILSGTKIHVSLPDVPQGIYHLEIITEKEILNIKIIIN